MSAPEAVDFQKLFELEELHPDLKKYLVDKPKLGKVLQHPLVYQVPYLPELAKLSNRLYEQKKKQLEEAKEHEDWEKFVFLHERPYRLPAFLDVAENIPTVAYWPLVHSIWIDSENVWQNQDGWLEVLDARNSSYLFMSDEERKKLESLPERFTIYRGYQEGRNKDGLSYTLDKKRALWFAKRYSSKDPKVRKRVVRKEQVFAYSAARSEEEIILRPEER